jgi:hypothetical protein
MIRLVIPDSGPLISLARIGRLDLIDRFRCPILITDVVEMELLDGPPDAPDAPVFKDWLGGRGNRIQIVETSYGQLLRQNRELLALLPEDQQNAQRRRFKVKNAGELSVREFSDEVRNRLAPQDSVLVLFEDQRVRTMSFGDHVHMMSSWSLAKAIENLGLIPSAEELFDQIERTGRTPPRDPFDREAKSGEPGDFIVSYDLS